MKEIRIFDKTGAFAGNKDIARDIRLNEILKYIGDENKIVLDFSGVESATQSFIHALISDVIRQRGINVLERIYFKNCSITIQKIISIVTEYMQESNY
ncbi:STAS-like domain-containing protein [Candidatus Pacearchaeota archaeon]|nr:STAS-like domain-containing protein [Candidatus Pacearchaeota archaeon]